MSKKDDLEEVSSQSEWSDQEDQPSGEVFSAERTPGKPTSSRSSSSDSTSSSSSTSTIVEAPISKQRALARQQDEEKPRNRAEQQGTRGRRRNRTRRQRREAKQRREAHQVLKVVIKQIGGHLDNVHLIVNINSQALDVRDIQFAKDLLEGKVNNLLIVVRKLWLVIAIGQQVIGNLLCLTMLDERQDANQEVLYVDAHRHRAEGRLHARDNPAARKVLQCLQQGPFTRISGFPCLPQDVLSSLRVLQHPVPPEVPPVLCQDVL